MSNSQPERNQIFISYGHNDVDIFNRVKVHFQSLNNADENFIYWEDTQIKAGSKWFDAIKQNLNRSKVAVLLISADFLASNFIKQYELPEILEAMEEPLNNLPKGEQEKHLAELTKTVAKALKA